MEVDFAFLADAADSVNGKLYLIGGAFDTIWAEQVPFVHPRLSFAMRLLFSPVEMGRTHQLEVHIITQDGKRLATVGGALDMGKMPDGAPKGHKQGFLNVMNFAGLKFSEFGTISFEIVLNNTNVKSVPLHIAQRMRTNPA